VQVLDHFSHCVDVVKDRVGLHEWFGTELLSHESGNEMIRLTCRSTDGTPRLAETKRLIKAPGRRDWLRQGRHESHPAKPAGIAPRLND
jgi:hypothetical protein